ncbi:MAG: type II secretion system protein [Candidatus Aminicenantes bacterium]|nr:type II secretion system protein [Candidatus Aminicenantes bacterium]
MVRRSEAGYTLLVLMVLISVLTVGLMVALPVLETQSWREKEEELLFRGRQYVEAVRLFVKENPGSYPESIEDLIKNRYLRKAFLEPMTKGGKWNLILLPAQAAAPAASRPIPSRGERTPKRIPDKDQDGEAEEAGAAGGETTSLQQVMVMPEKFLSSIDNPRIIGVVSPSGRKSFFIYDENETYDTWLFYYGREPGAKPEIIVFGAPTK